MLSPAVFLKQAFVLLFLLLAPSACYFSWSGGGGLLGQSLPSYGGDFAPSDSNYFYIDLDVDKYDDDLEIENFYEISTTEDYGSSADRDSPSNCEIEYIPYEEGDEGEETSETLICILDVPEWLFTLQDLNLSVNVPEGMCSSIAWSLPWHFNFPIIKGPSSIKCPVEVGEESKDLYCASTTNTGSKECPSNASETTCYEKEADLCASSRGAPKCCYGGEKEDGKKWKPDPRCFGGPALYATFAGQSIADSFYKRHLTEAPQDTEGFQLELTIPSLIGGIPGNSGELGSLPYANYLNALDGPAEDLEDIYSGALPLFAREEGSINDRIYNHIPNLFFKFACLDGAGEVLHELLLMIREWNTMEEFVSFWEDEDGGNDSADPDVTGDEGDECEYEQRFNSSGAPEPCNDWLDLDDIAEDRDYPGITIDENENENEE